MCLRFGGRLHIDLEGAEVEKSFAIVEAGETLRWKARTNTSIILIWWKENQETLCIQSARSQNNQTEEMWPCHRPQRCTRIWLGASDLEQEVINEQWTWSKSYFKWASLGTRCKKSVFFSSSKYFKTYVSSIPAWILAPKELYTWYYPMTIRHQPLFEHTPVLNNNFEYCRDDFVDCDFYED